MLSIIFTFRTPDSRNALGTRMNKEDKARIGQRLRATTAEEVNQFFERLPRDMLFVMRTVRRSRPTP